MTFKVFLPPYKKFNKPSSTMGKKILKCLTQKTSKSSLKQYAVSEPLFYINRTSSKCMFFILKDNTFTKSFNHLNITSIKFAFNFLHAYYYTNIFCEAISNIDNITPSPLKRLN